MVRPRFSMNEFILFPFVHVLSNWTLSNFVTQAFAVIAVAGIVLLVKSVIVGGDCD